MATTLTAGVFSQHGLIGIHCGDSRASIARDNGIIRLTVDQSEGERLFRKGKLTKEELADYPRKNILESALGVADAPRLDVFSFDIRRGDKVIFTSDGSHEKLLLRELREIASRHNRAASFIEESCKLISSRNPDDNFSMVAVFII